MNRKNKSFGLFGSIDGVSERRRESGWAYAAKENSELPLVLPRWGAIHCAYRDAAALETKFSEPRRRCRGRRLGKGGGCGLRREEAGAERRAVRTDTSRRRKRNCRSERWRGRARW